MRDSLPLVGTVVALLVVSATAAPVAAAASTLQSENATVGAGDRLQGAIGVQEAEVAGELETRRFGVAFAAADSNASKAAVVAEQATALETRLARLARQKQRLQRARENGSLPAGEYRARMAVLVTRTRTVARLANRTERAARGVPADRLAERGVDVAAIRELGRNASRLGGGEVAEIARSVAGPSAGREVAATNRPEVAGPPDRAGGSDGRERGGGERGDRGGNRSEGAGSQRPSLAERAYEFVTRTAGGLAAAAVGTVVGTASAQSQESETRPVLEVPVREDGSARVTLVLTFDLSGDAARRAFRTLRDDETARTDVRERFRSRMESIANQSEQVTGREMRVHDAAIDLSESADGETGVVRVSVAWEGLAAVEDGHLVVTEPFASGFTPDREFRVRITAPDSYRVTTARPEPGEQSAASVAWPAGTDLDGFTLVFSPEQRTSLPEERVEELQPTRTISETAGNPGVPGFGAGTALVALLAAGAVAVRRR